LKKIIPGIRLFRISSGFPEETEIVTIVEKQMIDKTQIDQDVRAREAIFCSPFLMCDFVT
jgi:hypothetical protein